MHLTPAEDFQKILSDWQEHLGAMQASDSDDLDVCCGQPFPDTIFDSDISLSAPPSSSSCSSSNSRSLLKPRQERLATAGGNVYGMKAESQDARLPIMADDSDDEDQLKPILDIKIEFDDEDCVDVETVADQMPGSEFISPIISILLNVLLAEIFKPSFYFEWKEKRFLIICSYEFNFLWATLKLLRL